MRMLSSCVIAALLLFCATAIETCVIQPKIPVTPHIESPMPHEYLNAKDIPAEFDWRNNNGTNYCTTSRNQHIPVYCGSCWAMGTSSALADRVKIMRNAKFPDYMIAVQTLVYCTNHGCHGGSGAVAYSYIHKNGIGPETCQNYISQGTGNECTAIHVCEDCSPQGNCSVIKDFPKFGVKEFGRVQGVKQMKAEIFARGPIACYLNADPIHAWGFGPHKKEIFSGCPDCDSINHLISVVGWGHDATSKMDYWVVRNSWGEYWGDLGYFRLKMGDNQLGMEETSCDWAVPTLPKELM